MTAAASATSARVRVVHVKGASSDTQWFCTPECEAAKPGPGVVRIPAFVPTTGSPRRCGTCRKKVR